MDGCIEWPGSRNQDGYGNRWHEGRCMKAHRVAWMEVHGPIPDGMLVLHRCDNPPCVNVEHLYLGDQSRNMRDMSERRRSNNQRKTHCPAGHPYNEENTYVLGARRACRVCGRENMRRYRAERKVST